MPTFPDGPGEHTADAVAEAVDPLRLLPAAGPRRATVVPDGPVLVDGPVEVRLPDGTVARSDRFLVALCACRRSKAYPWCDTSHRPRVRTDAGPDAGPDVRGG